MSSRDLNANDPRQLDRASQFFGSTEVRVRTGTASITERVDRWLATWSDLWAHREHLRSWEALSGDVPDPWGPELTADGGQYLAFADGLYMPTPEQFDFVRSGGLNDWEVDADKLGAIRDIVTDARRAGAEVWLLDSPVAGDWVDLHPNGALDVERYRAAIAELAVELAVPLIRPRPFPDPFFADVVHVNQRGARELSRLLGQCVADPSACPTV